LTSLLSCLVTCSRASPWASTTTVIRDRPSTSDAPTLSASMLNARPANSPETPRRPPRTSCTNADRAWRGIPGLVVTYRGHARGDLNLVIRDTGGHHWPHHRVSRYDEVDDHGAIVGLHRFFDGRGDIFFFFNADADSAVGFGELDE